jgi:hypothetical protein
LISILFIDFTGLGLFAALLDLQEFKLKEKITEKIIANKVVCLFMGSSLVNG